MPSAILSNSSNALDSIKSCISNVQSFYFESGAGSGKTYTLVQTLDFLLAQYGRMLQTRNQRIMVITYTNAATNEILERIGNTRLLDVSTIHTRLWSLIRPFQTQLVNIHLKNIQRQVKDLENELKNNFYYNDLALNNAIETDKEFIDNFYKYQNLKADEFKPIFVRYTTSGKISNVSKFKEYVRKTRKYLRLSSTIVKINGHANGFTKVEYDPKYNTDRLDKMKFSHDTLILYAKELITNSYTVQRIISDKYPYILVDEYQDTNPLVVDILFTIGTFSEKHKKDCVVGYYGDSCQNIYNDGVGTRLIEHHKGLIKVEENSNYRSKEEIVTIANKIRHDGLIQNSKRGSGGSAKGYHCSNVSLIDSFIDSMVVTFPENEKVHCLVLKNEIVASRMGFGDLFSVFSNAQYYKGAGYKQLSSEVLSDDVTKLGTVPLMLYKWMKMYSSISNPKIFINEYIPRSIYSKINLFQLKQIQNLVLALPVDTLEHFIDGISALSNQNNIIKDIFQYMVGKDSTITAAVAESRFFEELYADISDSDMSAAKVNIRKLMELPISICMNWFNYVSNSTNEQIQFHTFHGTKGLEFKNVVVVITNEFNQSKNYYSSYFENFMDERSYNDEKFLKKRNLLYVAVTRAKENLRVLYVDPVYKPKVKDNYELLFGNVEEYVGARTESWT